MQYFLIDMLSSKIQPWAKLNLLYFVHCVKARDVPHTGIPIFLRPLIQEFTIDLSSFLASHIFYSSPNYKKRFNRKISTIAIKIK